MLKERDIRLGFVSKLDWVGVDLGLRSRRILVWLDLGACLCIID